MASEKKRRKASKFVATPTPTPPPTGPFRHRDGDRRRRGGISVDEAIRLKRAIREAGSIVPDEPEDDEP